MKLTTITRTGGLATLALTVSLGLAACGGDDDSGSSASSEESSQSESSPSESMESESAMAGGAESQTFGAACETFPTTGAGSLEGMAGEPVATAASANPELETLVTAVGKAGLVDTLNSAEALTVFAPTNEAFAKIPAKDLEAVLNDKQALTEILTHHVVAGQLSPDQVAGEHETLNGDMLTVEGSGESYTVGDEMAAVVCGNVPTANATVYVVDTVLMP